MRSPFAARPVRQATLLRDTGDTELDGKPITIEMSVELRPWPIGYPEYLDRVFPAPVRYENGQPKEDPARRSEYQGQRMAILLARCMGDQLDAKAPAGEDRGVWEAYAKAILAEFEAANLVEGDVVRLMGEAQAVNRGAGKLGKA